MLLLARNMIVPNAYDILNLIENEKFNKVSDEVKSTLLSPGNIKKIIEKAQAGDPIAKQIFKRLAELDAIVITKDLNDQFKPNTIISALMKTGDIESINKVLFSTQNKGFLNIVGFDNNRKPIDLRNQIDLRALYAALANTSPDKSETLELLKERANVNFIMRKADGHSDVLGLGENNLLAIACARKDISMIDRLLELKSQKGTFIIDSISKNALGFNAVHNYLAAQEPGEVAAEYINTLK